MEVRRVPNQAGVTLQNFFAGYTTGPGSQSEEIGRRMLAFLERLSAADGPPVWGLTSHGTLHLFVEAGGPTALVHGHRPGYVVEAYGPGAAGGGTAADADGAVALVLAVLRRAAAAAPAAVEPLPPGNWWPDEEYVPYIQAEQRLYAWVLVRVGGVDPDEAMRRAGARFRYEPMATRGIITHDGAWRIAMADLFRDHTRQPEAFGIADEFEAEKERLFRHDG